MKKILSSILIFLILGSIFVWHDTISDFIIINFIYKRDIVIMDANKYKKDIHVNYVKQTTNFEPENKEDLKNILYTILNNGWHSFTFFCNKNYETCIDDVNTMVNDKATISHLNNFVSPYNTYNKLYINYNNFGKITIDVEKIYTDDQIKLINNQLDVIINQIITPNMNNEQKIKTFHDYIINNTLYDSKNAEVLKKNGEINTTDNSHNAYGLLFNHLALCGGYSDTMALFLDRLGIPNIKISNNSHVWNLVYLNNSWSHLDATWDDPIVDTKENLLLHNYFLITNNDLQTKDNSYHKFDFNIYAEAK